MLQDPGRGQVVTIIFYLIPLGVVLVVLAVGAFFWAVRAGQFDDLETPAWRILLDDDSAPPENKKINKNQDKTSDFQNKH
ncbi:MAG: cbb3-type cytochrome oxidase assembly protein CcoS [Gammaproteobacteria bacterium]